MTIVKEGEAKKEEKEDGEFPRLVLYFKENDEFSRGVVVADGVTIDTQANDIPYATVVLIACYYVFNIEYPLW